MAIQEINRFVIIALNLQTGLYCIAGTVNEREQVVDMVNGLLKASENLSNYGFFAFDCDPEKMVFQVRGVN